MQVICYYFQSCTFLFYPIFERITCIQHHFTFLFWLSARKFSSPNRRFQHLKPCFLTAISPFSAQCFMARRGFIYTIAVDIYAFRHAFSTILPCVLHQNALHLAPKRIAFSTKTHCNQHQNALHLAPKYTAFSGILHYIQPQIAQKQVQMAAFLNKNSFCRNHMLTPFCIKTNLRENRFFATRWTLDG